MCAAVRERMGSVAAFYLQPDQIRFPFRLPLPGRKGLQLGEGWAYLVEMDSLRKMAGTQPEVLFLCDFPVTFLVEGGALPHFRPGARVRIGEAEGKVAICGDICGEEKSRRCGFSAACALRHEAVLVQIDRPGTVRVGSLLRRA